MHRHAVVLMLATLLAGAAAAQDPPAESFTLEELVERLDKSGRPYLPFLDRSTLSTGIYRLSAGAEDRQSPHEIDEVYYVVEGRATLEVGEEKHEAKPGSLLFVAAHAEHRFVDIEEDLLVVVFFSKADVDG